MTETANTPSSTWQQRFKKARRKRVKKFGKNLIRGLADFLGRQSMVGDAPILDSKRFTFLKTFTDDWQTIRDEVTEILKHREAIPVFQDVSPDQMKISKGNNWRTFILFGFGEKLAKNCKQAPSPRASLRPCQICKPHGSRFWVRAIISPPIAASARASCAPISA